MSLVLSDLFLTTSFQNAIHQAEDIPVIEPERELIEVEREILLRDFMKDTYDPALDQRPDVLAAVHKPLFMHAGRVDADFAN